MLCYDWVMTTNLSQLKIAKLRSKNKRTLSMILEKGFESTVHNLHSIKINKNLIMKWFNWHGFCNIIIRYLHHRMASSIENVKARMGRMVNEDTVSF